MGYVSKIEIELDKVKEISLLYEDFFNLVVHDKASIDSADVQKLITKISDWYNR